MNSKQELVKTQEQAKARLNAMPFASFINQGAIQNRIAKTIGSERGQRLSSLLQILLC